MATKRRSTRKVRGRTQKKRSMKRNTKSNRGRKNRNLKRGGTNKKHSLKRNRKQRGGSMAKQHRLASEVEEQNRKLWETRNMELWLKIRDAADERARAEERSGKGSVEWRIAHDNVYKARDDFRDHERSGTIDNKRSW